MSEAQRIKAKKRIIKELEQYPIKGVACQRAGIPRATFYRWLIDDEKFKQDIEKAQFSGYENINDLAESKIIASIKDGAQKSARYWLENHHPKYKYKTKSKEKKIDPVEEILIGFGLNPRSIPRGYLNGK